MKINFPRHIIAFLFLSFLPVSHVFAESLWGDIKSIGEDFADETKKVGKDIEKEVDRTKLKEVANDMKLESETVLKDSRKEIKR